MKYLVQIPDGRYVGGRPSPAGYGLTTARGLAIVFEDSADALSYVDQKGIIGAILIPRN